MKSADSNDTEELGVSLALHEYNGYSWVALLSSLMKMLLLLPLMKMLPLFLEVMTVGLILPLSLLMVGMKMLRKMMEMMVPMMMMWFSLCER